jgi:transglutaminase-like putative cysteine protease
MRANSVPARPLYGRWAESTNPVEKVGGEPYHQWHVKAEFHAAGVGWVPVDLSSALKDQSPEGLGCFGKDDGDFIVFHIDSDLVVNTGTFGVQTVEYMQLPSYWVSGRGSLKPTTITELWTVKELRTR